jgi:hypothetical protein
MKNLIFTCLFLTSLHAYADIDTSKLAGSWKSSCTQQQESNGKSGHMTETYTFSKSGNYDLLRQWYQDGACKQATDKDKESGLILIGKENLNNGFNPAGTFETQFKSNNSNYLGLIWVDSMYENLRLSRGIGKSQNTMLGLFVYKKQ